MGVVFTLNSGPLGMPAAVTRRALMVGGGGVNPDGSLNQTAIESPSPSIARATRRWFPEVIVVLTFHSSVTGAPMVEAALHTAGNSATATEARAMAFKHRCVPPSTHEPDAYDRWKTAHFDFIPRTFFAGGRRR
ncbi:hypothetical protein [Tahibacter amnicola]|uniref:Uncharacterized protein n=1 Tax=Tahibacter amnicola TaxID=2976241 RepID=A0ABY6BKD6_9GAMM|nr:hypothetical protein [Tahibacter amnicola]UXI70364.1 hypothetical protein N4264_12240 [Tahibacter amnicola]